MLKEKPIVVTVEPAKLTDLPIVTSIYRQHKGICEGVNKDNTFVAKDGSGDIVGAITVNRNYIRFLELGANCAELRVIGVKPELQDREIGRQMVSKVIEEMKREGFSRIEVKIDPAKEDMIELFDKLGFEAKGGMPLVTMVKHV